MSVFRKISNGISRFLDNFRVKYVTRCADASVPQFKQVDKALIHENARLMAEVHKLQNKIQELEKLLDEVSKEPDVVQDSEVFLKKIREQTTFRFLLYSRKPVILASSVTKTPFKGIDGREFKYLRGFEFEKTPYGVFVNALLSHEKPNKNLFKRNEEVWRLRLCRFEELPYLIYDIDRLVDFLKEGWLFINLMPNGQMIPPAMHIDKDAIEDLIASQEDGVSDEEVKGRDKRNVKNRRGSNKD